MAWEEIFSRYDVDGSTQLDWHEFRMACRGDCELSTDMISDRELSILFQRLDSDDSGAICLLEWENFLTAGPTADAERHAVVYIQARHRGKMLRRRRLLRGVTRCAIDTERDDWKLEMLTNDELRDEGGINRGLWGMLLAALSPPGRGAILVCATAARAAWLVGRLQAKPCEMACALLHSDMQLPECREVLDAWKDTQSKDSFDAYGRRRLIVMSDMPPASLASLQLHKLGCNLVVNYDLPKFFAQFLPRVTSFAHREVRDRTHRGLEVTLVTSQQQARLRSFERRTGHALEPLPVDAHIQVAELAQGTGIPTPNLSSASRIDRLPAVFSVRFDRSLMDVLWPHCSSCVLCLLVELAVEQRQKETALAQKAAAHAKRHDQDWPAEAVALYDDRAAAGERCLRAATWEWA